MIRIPKPIITLGKKAGKWIRSGGLILEDDYSQVDKRVHVLLAKINELGYITFDSQEGNVGERAYLSGFLPRDFAVLFVEQFNLRTNMIALSTMSGDYDPLYRIPVTKSKKCEAQTRYPYVLEQKSIKHLQSQANIPKSVAKDMVIVECIDPEWGRKATNTSGLFKAVFDVMNVMKKITRN